MLPLTIPELLEAFQELGVYSASLDRRVALAQKVISNGFSRENLAALLVKVSEADAPAGLAVRILSGSWKADLANVLRGGKPADDGPPGHYDKTAEETYRERMDRAGMSSAEFERDRQVTVAVEHLHFGRTNLRGDKPTLEYPTAAQLALELGMTEAEFAAAVEERERRRTLDAPQAKPAVPLRLGDVEDRKKAKAELDAEAAECEEERKAILAETPHGERLPDPAPRVEADRPPVYENRHRLDPTPGPGNSMPEHWNHQLAEADRAWAERFPMFRFIDPKMHKAMLAGPEPRPWVKRAISASADRIAGKNPKWSGRHADHRPRSV